MFLKKAQDTAAAKCTALLIDKNIWTKKTERDFHTMPNVSTVNRRLLQTIIDKAAHYFSC